jgi:hypothetical protein
MAVSSHTEAQIRLKLQQIHAVTLQKLAEDLACVKFPDRFGMRTLRRAGRNDEDQTTKGWPDAFVSTGQNEVDGVEATRQAQTWRKHLESDLAHADDPMYRNLSGYVFVGGYPGDAPTAAQLDEWVDRFVIAGVDRARVTILVGSDLVAELCKPEYAAIRQVHLGLAAVPEWFRLLGEVPISDARLNLFKPTQNEYESRLVRAPSITDLVIDDLLRGGCALVLGHGAAGKTTLAELIARHERIAPNTVWYVDLTQATAEEAGSGLVNEMTELAARGTLFVVDNVHVDSSHARRTQDHWRRHLASLDTRLLLLGRRISRRDTKSGSTLPSHELRAGVAEMLAVVDRLAAREGRKLPPIPASTLGAWARLFGGSDLPDQTAVDLIAFTAAVDRRLQQIALADFRLSASDAIDAVRVRYLQPLQEKHELQNILRLAALAEFEIPLMNEQLPEPVAGLTEAVNTLGIVVYDDLGLEARRHYRLVHAGVGPLLLEAAGANSRLRDERLRAVATSPILGRRISGALRQAKSGGDAHRAFDHAVLKALNSSTWPSRTQTLYELENLARYAAREGVAAPEMIDAAIVDLDVIPHMLDRAPALPAVNYFLARAAQVPLPRAIATLSAAAARQPLLDVLSTSRPSDVATLIRLAQNGAEILTHIDFLRWDEGQSRSSVEAVSSTISACRFFENSGRPELARAPALRQVTSADPKLWDHYDLSFLSHLLRLARPDYEAVERLLKCLTSSGWLSATFAQGINGQLCGALLSLANYLESSLRIYILTPQLETRLTRELSHPQSARKQDLRRPVCMLGGFDALGGQLGLGPQIDWSKDPQAELLLDEVAHSESTSEVGTYEIQLWLGLKALHRLGQGPTAVPARRGESFLTRLGGAPHPTSQAGNIQRDLVKWLKQLKNAGWRFDRIG